jgi:hypothetical protein
MRNLYFNEVIICFKANIYLFNIISTNIMYELKNLKDDDFKVIKFDFIFEKLEVDSDNDIFCTFFLTITFFYCDENIFDDVTSKILKICKSIIDKGKEKDSNFLSEKLNEEKSKLFNFISENSNKIFTHYLAHTLESQLTRIITYYNN